MKNCIVVIPVYKDTLDCVEEISLKRLYTVIGKSNHDVCLVYPDGMKTKAYDKLYPGMQHKTYDPKYFKSTAAYSQLCMEYNFYADFAKDYEYMLIYQLDCYLFRDEIDYWCEQGYDYIGGPIISTDCGWDTVKKYQNKTTWKPFVGNGGLSLRKLQTFMDILDPNGEIFDYILLTGINMSEVKYEDKFFCNDLYEVYDLNVPDWKIAVNFALDMSVDIVYNQFKFNKQPMGIHSVDKNIRWWKKVIPEFSDPKVIEYCENKHKEFFKLYYDENDSTLRKA